MGLLKEEVKHIEPGPISEAASREAGSLFIALIVKGFQPEDIIGILSDALGRAEVLFSPNLETALANHDGNAQSVRECIETNWPGRADLEANTERRVQHMLPVRALFEEITGTPYGAWRKEQAKEPATS